MARRAWVYTINNPTEEEVNSILIGESLPSGFRYRVNGLEIGESGTMHLQGYCELTKPMRMPQVKRLICPGRPDQVHVEPRMGTREQAREYIADDGKDGSLGWVECGSWESGGSGARSDLLACKDLIDNGASTVEICEEYFPTWVHNYRALEYYTTLKRRQSVPQWRQLSVHVLYGTAGSGKTRAAVAASESYYLMGQPPSDTLWFDFYNGEDTLILDDFSGWIPLALLLRLLDGYPVRLPTKGGHTVAAWTKVIITANLPPHSWYNPDVMQRHPGALSRRITSITKYTMAGPCLVFWGME